MQNIFLFYLCYFVIQNLRYPWVDLDPSVTVDVTYDPKHVKAIYISPSVTIVSRTQLMPKSYIIIHFWQNSIHMRKNPILIDAEPCYAIIQQFS